MLRAFRRSGRGSSEHPALPVPAVVGLVGVALVAALALLFVERRRVDAALKDVLLANARVTAELRASIEALEERDAETRAASRDALARLAEHSIAVDVLADLRAATADTDARLLEALVTIAPAAEAMATVEAQVAELGGWFAGMRAAQEALAAELESFREPTGDGVARGIAWLVDGMNAAIEDMNDGFARYAADISAVREHVANLEVRDISARLELLEGGLVTARLEAQHAALTKADIEDGGPVRRNSHFGSVVTAMGALAGAVPYVTPATKLAILELVAAQRQRHFV